MYNIVDTLKNKTVAYGLTEEEGNTFINAQKKEIKWLQDRPSDSDDWLDVFARFRLERVD